MLYYLITPYSPRIQPHEVLRSHSVLLNEFILKRSFFLLWTFYNPMGWYAGEFGVIETIKHHNLYYLA